MFLFVCFEDKFIGKVYIMMEVRLVFLFKNEDEYIILERYINRNY